MNRVKLRLFLCGFLILFLELLLIRYLAANVWNMGYFPNLVLIAVFIGMGFGFVFHRLIPEDQSVAVFQGSSIVLVLMVLFLHYNHPIVPGFSHGATSLSGEIFFSSSPRETNFKDFIIFVFIFLAIVLTFFLISQLTAKFFRHFKPLKSYTLDISGSCAGILTFMLISWFQVPAWIWFVIVIPLFLFILDRPISKRNIPMLIMLLIPVYFVHKQDLQLSNKQFLGPLEVKWSPYQKVEYIPRPRYHIFVNGIGHQSMISPKALKSSYYTEPYRYREQNNLPKAEDVLVIGAGSGNDVAAALMFGAERVDAVEIDPVIAEFGKKYHPAKPYLDPRVNLVINDARAFLTYTNRKYDVVVFALTDSLVKASPMAQLRLENYLFTEESVRLAFKRLKKDGNLLFYNYYRRPWIKQKIERMIYLIIGHFPVTLPQKDKGLSMMIVDRRKPVQQSNIGEDLDIPVDDWPFLYLPHRGIPPVYLKTMIGLSIFLLMFGVAMQRIKNTTEQNQTDQGLVKGAFFFMGLAFLLLESKSIIQFSLLFGTTWLNNSLVFLAVLVLVLLANHLAHLVPRLWLLKLAYVLLICVCLFQFFFPLSFLLRFENPFLRFILASLLVFSPIFFANLIFSITFRDRPLAEQLFGWNLLGAFFGGLMEYTSMAIGYSSLSIIVAVSYTIVFLLLMLELRKSQFSH